MNLRTVYMVLVVAHVATPMTLGAPIPIFRSSTAASSPAGQEGTLVALGASMVTSSATGRSTPQLQPRASWTDEAVDVSNAIVSGSVSSSVDNAARFTALAQDVRKPRRSARKLDPLDLPEQTSLPEQSRAAISQAGTGYYHVTFTNGDTYYIPAPAQGGQRDLSILSSHQKIEVYRLDKQFRQLYDHQYIQSRERESKIISAVRDDLRSEGQGHFFRNLPQDERRKRLRDMSTKLEASSSKSSTDMHLPHNKRAKIDQTSSAAPLPSQHQPVPSAVATSSAQLQTQADAALNHQSQSKARFDLNMAWWMNP